ncbi:MAG: GNAT family protein [Armatimonadota bacterium]
MPITMPVITGRLIIREFTPADWEAFHEYSTQPDVLQFHKFSPESELDTRRFLDEIIASQSDSPRRRFEMAVTLKTEGQVIGGCGLYLLPRHDQAAIGYVLNRNFWGFGYATEVAEALLRAAFTDMGIHRISTWCDTENSRSAKVLEKIGMRREGHFIKDRQHAGKWRDSYSYAILEEEWTKRHSNAGC